MNGKEALATCLHVDLYLPEEWEVIFVIYYIWKEDENGPHSQCHCCSINIWVSLHLGKPTSALACLHENLSLSGFGQLPIGLKDWKGRK